MKTRMTACIVAVAVLAAFSAPSAQQAPFSRIVVFGTSVSDNGNAFVLWGTGVNTPPDYLLSALLVPDAPYARGGHHFTNGATWIEQYARSRGLAGSVRPAFVGSDAHATNYAVAAARAHQDGKNFNLTLQVDTFLERFGNVVPGDALYVVEIGGNDVRDALEAFGRGEDGGLILQAAAVSVAQNMQRLYLAGARQFLVWRTPNMGLIPSIRMVDAVRPGTAMYATMLTQAFNGGVDAVVGQLSYLPGISIARLDGYAMINELVAHPELYGLSNVTTGCVTPGVEPFKCERPDEFLFWDGIHPTHAVHTITAQLAAAVLGR